MKGQRIIRVMPTMLVEMLKRYDGRSRSFTVEDPLPDDAELVDVLYDDTLGNVRLVLASDEWEEGRREALEYPSIVVTFGEVERDAQA